MLQKAMSNEGSKASFFRGKDKHQEIKTSGNQSGNLTMAYEGLSIIQRLMTPNPRNPQNDLFTCVQKSNGPPSLSSYQWSDDVQLRSSATNYQHGQRSSLRFITRDFDEIWTPEVSTQKCRGYTRWTLEWDTFRQGLLLTEWIWQTRYWNMSLSELVYWTWSSYEIPVAL